MSIQIEFLQICERAETLVDGSVNIFGLTDTFRSPNYPFNRSFAIVCRFRVPAKKHVTGKLGFQLFDPDDQRIWYQNGTLDSFFKGSPEEPESIASTMVLGSPNFRFEKAGSYQVQAVWDGQVVAAAPIFMFYPIPLGIEPGRGEVIDNR